MPGAKWVDPPKLIDFLLAHGFEIMLQKKHLAVLHSKTVSCPILVPTSRAMTQTVAEDILNSAQIPRSEWEAIL
jgi:hypothetical protein